MKQDLIWQRVLTLAEKRQGFCAPNPAVACVIVKNNTIVGEGYHLQAGADHAEVMALKACKEQANGADVYVSLEPCCHHGRTPPCTQALIKAGVARVFFAYQDPNPQVAGQGVVQLRDAGIVCEQVSMPMFNRFYRAYDHWQQTGRPWVMVKLAMSLDGKIAAKDGTPLALTGPALAKLTHRYRYHSDAVLTSLRTIEADDPQLNARIDDGVFAKPLMILDRRCALSEHAQVLQTAASIVVFHGEQAPAKDRARLEGLGVRLCCVSRASTGGLCLSSIISKIGALGYHQLWIEAGGQLCSSLLARHAADQFLLYLTPKLLGEGRPAFILKQQLDLRLVDLHQEAGEVVLVLQLQSSEEGPVQ
jgi:diaminohydroxyphosphoribosylaminopyrimidine deaminase/5-amino-6-(5-phosphoribosylamino)uracil reductase